MKSVLVKGFVALAVVVLIALPNAANCAGVALEGRAWTQTEEFQLPGHAWTLPYFLGTGPTGAPYAVVSLTGGTLGRQAGRIDWIDSAWVLKWKLNYPTNPLQPMKGPGRTGFVWNPPNGFSLPGVGDRQWVLTAEDFGNSVSVPDTVSHMWAGHFSYGGTMSAQRRWVAFGDNYESFMKLYYSDTTGIWHPIPVPGRGSEGIGMIAIDDTTALLAWGETLDPSIRWGVVRGSSFEEGSSPPNKEGLSASPTWIARPSGGWWLAWVSKTNHISVAHLEGMAWPLRLNIEANYVPPGNYYTDGIVELQDVGLDYPVAGWSASRSGSYEQVYCLSLPTVDSFGTGNQLETRVDAFVPNFVVDSNGDSWIAWKTYAFHGMYFTHTHTRATCGKPSVLGTTDSRVIRWVLSEPASESWWAVMRSAGGGPFEVLARVQADSDEELQYVDASSATGIAKYRIRRESMDKRFEWLSPEQYWLQRKPRIQARVIGSSPARNEVVLAVEDEASESVEIKMFDILGREVLSSRRAAGQGDGIIRLRLNDARRRVQSGLYFIRIQGQSGEVGSSLRIVVVR